eukprot:gene32972-42076_t
MEENSRRSAGAGSKELEIARMEELFAADLENVRAREQLRGGRPAAQSQAHSKHLHPLPFRSRGAKDHLDTIEALFEADLAKMASETGSSSSSSSLSENNQSSAREMSQPGPTGVSGAAAVDQGERFAAPPPGGAAPAGRRGDRDVVQQLAAQEGEDEKAVGDGILFDEDSALDADEALLEEALDERYPGEEDVGEKQVEEEEVGVEDEKEVKVKIGEEKQELKGEEQIQENEMAEKAEAAMDGEAEVARKEAEAVVNEELAVLKDEQAAAKNDAAVVEKAADVLLAEEEVAHGSEAAVRDQELKKLEEGGARETTSQVGIRIVTEGGDQVTTKSPIMVAKETVLFDAEHLARQEGPTPPVGTQETRQRWEHLSATDQPTTDD